MTSSMFSTPKPHSNNWAGTHTAGPGSPIRPLSPLSPGWPTTPRCPGVPAGPGGPSGPWKRNTRAVRDLFVYGCWKVSTAERFNELLPASYRGAVLSRVSLLSGAARQAWRSPLSLASCSSVISSNPSGALLSWSAYGPVCPDSTLKHINVLPSVQILETQMWLNEATAGMRLKQR